MTITGTSKRSKRVVGSVALTATLAGVGAGLVQQASAAEAPSPAPPGFIGIVTQPSHLGTFSPGDFAGTQVICIDAGKFYPTTKTAATKNGSSPEVSYLVSKYSQTKDPITAAALVYITKLKFDSQQDIVAESYKTIPASQKAAFDAKVKELNAEAAKNAGPYSIPLSVSDSKVNVGDTVKVGGIEVKGKSANLSDYTLKLTINGPATFSDGSKSKSFKTTAAAQSAELKATGKGTVTVTTSNDALPNSDVYIHAAQSSAYQRMIEYVNTGHETVTGSTKFTVDAAAQPTEHTVVPKVTTQAQGQSADKGASISDIVTGSGVPANAKVSGTDTLYRVKAGTTVTPGTVPDSAEKVKTYDWSATADSKGDFKAETEKYTVPEDGYDYYYVEALNSGSQGDTKWAASTGVFGDTAETVHGKVPDQPGNTTVTPKVTTKANGDKADKGSVISDTITGSGVPANAAVSGTDDLYRVKAGTAVTPGTVPADAEKVKSFDWKSTADAQGNFTAETEKYTVPEDGYDYYYVESLNGGSQGNTTWTPAKGTFGDTAETVHGTVPTTPSHQTVVPKVTTQAQGANSNKGSVISDNVMGSGVPANAKVSGTDDLYRVKAGTKVENGTVPAGAEKVKTFNWESTADAQGNFTATTEKYTVPEDGYDYYYVESLNGGSQGDTSWTASKGTFGDTAETVHYNAPTATTPKVTTQAQGANSNKGSVISDIVRGSGVPGGAAVSGTDDLYRVKAGTVVTQGKIPAGAEKVKTFDWNATAKADGTFEARTAGYTIPEDGYDYYYVESLNAGTHGNSTWNAVKGTFGDTAETVHYKAPTPEQPKPSTPTHPSTPVTPSQPTPQGPKVQTDHAVSTNLATEGGLASIVVLGGAATLVARRRRGLNN